MKQIHPKGTFTLEDLLAKLRSRPEFSKTGAIGLFIGVVRGFTVRGEKVDSLEIEAYEEMAEEKLKEICRDLERKPGIVAVEIHHFTGKFKVGEPLVYVAVAGSHRKEVFESLREAVERYKREAPLFKKEVLTTGKSYWVEEPER